MAYTDIQKIRLEVADVDISFPILTDSDYEYFLEKNNNNIIKASLDAARTLLLVLSQRTDETVDIFSIRGSKASESYRLALQLYLNNPNLNPILNNTSAYFGGVSISDMQSNNSTLDNNIVTNPYTENNLRFPKSAFEV